MKGFVIVALLCLAFSEAKDYRKKHLNRLSRSRSFFDDSCIPTCENGEEFTFMVAEGANCPTDISDRKAFRSTVVNPKNFCNVPLEVKLHLKLQFF